MYTPNKNSVPYHNKNTIGLQKYTYLPSHITPFASVFKSLKTKQMMIELKLQILHVIINMIPHVLVNMIL